jgi:ribonuclease P protein component
MCAAFTAMRLPRSHTIKKRADFLRVKETGRAKAGRFVIVSTLEEASLPRLMIGFITTRRIGKAHDRNRVRRRLREVVRAHASDMVDLRRYLVTIARPGSAQADFAQLEADWLKQARRLGLIARSNDPA